MKLHNKLQQVDLDTLGKFTQRVTYQGYTLEDLDSILDHRYFDEGCLVERLNEVGKLILRACRPVGFTLEDIISILDSKVTKEPEDSKIIKYKVDLDFSDALSKMKSFNKLVKGE